MIKFIHSVLHPAAYHGHRFGAPFFEGWYYKVVSANGNHCLAIIPGVFRHRDSRQSFAFIQIIDAASKELIYHTWPLDEFKAATDGELRVGIGKNIFTEKSLSLSLDNNSTSISGSLSFSPICPWPVTLRSPGIMGWYAWIPIMECYHGVVSMDHPVQGALTISGRTIDFTDGRGYIEKDWGSSFPSSWIWMQGNHFNLTGTSLSASIAIIPWRKSAFPGFIVGFLFEKQLYRFTTYNGAKIRFLSVEKNAVNWVLTRKDLVLEICCSREETFRLKAPTQNGMTREIPETLESRINVTLTKAGQTLFQGTSTHGGLEVMNHEALFQQSGDVLPPQSR